MGAGEFKQRCLALLDEVDTTGEPIVVTKRGRPVAQLAPLTNDERGDWRDAMSGRGDILGDLVAPASDLAEWDVLRT